MSLRDAAATASTGADQGDEDYDDVVCPLCHEEFPKLTWRGSGRNRYLCCGKSVCDNCDRGLTGTYLHNARQEGARRGVEPTIDQIKEKAECPFCRSAVLVSASEKVRRAHVLADRGKPWAWVMLGVHYRGGIGTEENAALAVECFRKAAEMGYTLGQHYLGECYLLELGTEIDVDEAAVWFERAAATGFSMSQRYLGLILSGEMGPTSVPIDHKRAFELFSDAARQGFSLAQADLASAYNSCLGVPPSLEQSIFWDRKAAMQGVVSAQRNLGASYYRKGIDDKFLPATSPIALFWARKAAAADDPHATPIIRAMELLTANRCWYCTAPASALPSRLLRCSRCKEGHYCSVDHQKKHWKIHKRWCDEVKVASEEYEKTPKNPRPNLYTY